MTDTIVVPRGARNAAQNRADEKAARKSAGSFGAWEYFKLEEPEDKGSESNGETAYIQLTLEEYDWIETKQHSFLNTKPAPSNLPEGRNWPKQLGSVCRRSRGYADVYHDCYVCEGKEYQKLNQYKKMTGPFASLKMWAPAVLQVPIYGTEEMVAAGKIKPHQLKKIVGFQDATKDKIETNLAGEPTGTTLQVPRWVVINQGMKNFFDALLAYDDSYGTLLDRVYRVTRKGSGTETRYAITPSLEWRDLRDPDVAADYQLPFDLQSIPNDLASDAYYEKFFDYRVDWKFPASEESDVAGEADAEATQAESTLKAMRDRMSK